MKTKFKTSPKSQNNSILENSNFLNNQNYILGNTKKKKIILKMFIEYNLKVFLNILEKFSNLVFNGYLLFLAPVFFYYIIYINNKDESYRIFFGIILGIFLLIFFIYFYFINIQKNKYTFSNLKEYFFKKGTSENINFIHGFIKVFSYYFGVTFLLVSSLKGSGIPEAIKYFLFLFSIFGGIFFVGYINLFNFLIFPFVLIYITFFASINYILLFKKHNLYYIIVKKITNNLQLKFYEINKHKAENIYYKIYKK